MAPSKMKIVWTQRATRHLHAAYEYWASEKSYAAADEMMERIFSTAEVLERHPELGRRGRISGTRELVLHPTPFVMAYRIRRQTIEVVAFLHGARKWPGRF
jgi:toxin ParE1/3/4